jgi:hypothetical protein
MAIKIGIENEGKNKYDPTPVLFAVESQNDITSFCKYLDEGKKQIDPKSLSHHKFRPPDIPARILAFFGFSRRLRGENHERCLGTISPCETSIML